MAEVSKVSSAPKSDVLPSAEPDAGTSELQASVAPGVGDEPTHEIVGLESEPGPSVSEADKKDDLVKAAQDRELDSSGTKQELADRINAHDAEGVHKPEVLYRHEEE